MTKFHVNSETGESGVCRARKQCRYGNNTPHFSTENEALDHWASTQFTEADKLTGRQKGIVLSDIDGTLLKSSLVLNNAVELHDHGVLKLGRLPNQWRKDMKNEKVIVRLAEAYRKAITGRSPDELYPYKTLRNLLENDKSFYSAIRILKQYKENGHEVVLISGSPSFLVKPLADHFGFKYYASEYVENKDGFTGEIILRAGSNAKQEVLDSLNLHKYDRIVALGDTASDAPLFKAADHSILVDPSEETIQNLEKQKVKIDKIIRN